MKKLLWLPLFAALILSGCDFSGKKGPVGEWKFVSGQFVSPQPAADSTVIELKKMVESALLPTFNGAEYELLKSGEAERKINGKAEAGTWSQPSETELALAFGDAKLNWKIVRLTKDSLYVRQNEEGYALDLVLVKEAATDGD